MPDRQDMIVWAEIFFIWCFCISFQIVLVGSVKAIFHKNSSFSERKEEGKGIDLPCLKAKVKGKSFP